MKTKMILLLMMIWCVTAAGCASAPPAPATPLKPSQMPSPVSGKTPGPIPETSPAATPGETPETEPADSESQTFFFQAPEDAPREVEIHIYKGRRVLELKMDGEVIGRFPIGLGFAPEGDKEREGDGRTPVGEYYVCSRNNRSNFYLSLGVSYPNTEDAQRGLDSGLIDRQTYEGIAGAEERRALPDWYTPLGGEICIHGGGSQRDWTWGCVALENQAMDILWEYCPHGTPIFIYE